MPVDSMTPFFVVVKLKQKILFNGCIDLSSCDSRILTLLSQCHEHIELQLQFVSVLEILQNMGDAQHLQLIFKLDCANSLLLYNFLL